MKTITLTDQWVSTMIERNPQFLAYAQENADSVTVQQFFLDSEGYKIESFLTEPKGNTQDLPVVIYLRGGSGETGVYKLGDFFAEMADIAQQGYRVYTLNYRGTGRSEGRDTIGGDDIQDIINLIDYALKYSENQKTVSLVGRSRGGMMIYKILTDKDISNKISAAVTIGAPTNLFRQIELRPNMKPYYEKMFGGSDEDYINRSALFWSEKIIDSVPLLIMHGESDTSVSVEDSKDLCRKLTDNKHTNHRCVFYPNAEHPIREYKQEVYQNIINGILQNP